MDLLSGSYLPGDVFWFPGVEGGGFAERRALYDLADDPLRVGRASWPFALDWNADGDLDLVLGNMYGRVFLAHNAGGPGTPRYSAAEPLLAGGEPIAWRQTNAAPCVADWDGDGARDLLLGLGDGSVRLYRGRSGAKPALAESLELVPPSPSGPAEVRLARPGPRARVATCDWNADGRLDLLAGEYSCEDGPKPRLSAQQERELAETLQASRAQASRRAELEQSAFAAWLEKRHVAPGAASEHYDSFLDEWLATPAALELTRRQDELTAILRKLNAPVIEHGRVWVFLRTAGATR